MNEDAHITVGHDGKPASVRALSWAAHMASLRGEAVVAITVVDPREYARGAGWPESYWDDMDERARGVVASWPGVPFRAERHTGPKIATLVGSAAGSSMLVVGSKGHGYVAEILRGSVSQSAARHAAVPVVVVRKLKNPGSGRIVVGSDGSAPSARALEFACGMARLTGAKVVVWRAGYPAGDTPLRGTPPPVEESVDAVTAAGRVVDELRATHPDVAIESEVYLGDAGHGLVQASENASLVVVGSRGLSALDEAVEGSVSTAVLHKAHCPVAVVH